MFDLKFTCVFAVLSFLSYFGLLYIACVCICDTRKNTQMPVTPIPNEATTASAIRDLKWQMTEGESKRHIKKFTIAKFRKFCGFFPGFLIDLLFICYFIFCFKYSYMKIQWNVRLMDWIRLVFDMYAKPKTSNRPPFSENNKNASISLYRSTWSHLNP